MSLITIEGGKGKAEAETHEEMLESLRALVKRLEDDGPVCSFAIAVTMSDGCVATQWNGEDHFTLLGTLRWLQRRVEDSVEQNQ